MHPWLPHQTILPCLAEMSSLFRHSPLSCLSEYLFLLWATILSLHNLYIMAATSIGPMHFQIVAATTICLQAYRSSMVPSCSLHYQIEPCHKKNCKNILEINSSVEATQENWQENGLFNCPVSLLPKLPLLPALAV